MKGYGGPPLLIIHFFYRQKVSLALQRVQATTILRQAIVATKKAYLGLVCFQVFCTSPCMICFVLLVMGLGPRSCVFSS